MINLGKSIFLPWWNCITASNHIEALQIAAESFSDGKRFSTQFIPVFQTATAKMMQMVLCTACIGIHLLSLSKVTQKVVPVDLSLLGTLLIRL